MRASEVVRGVSTAHDIFVARAEGARLWDITGKEYLDLAGGIGVLNVGHSNPSVRAAIDAQLARFSHACFQVAMYEPYVRVAQALNRIAPMSGKKKTLLLSTGAEATENAIKIARAYTGRPAVVAFQFGYHGRTLLALSMTGKNEPYKQRFGPFCSEIYHAPFPYEYRGWTTASALSGLRDLLQTEVSPDRVAAFIIEPVLGEGGFVPAPFDYMRELRRIASEHGIVLVCDEIQTGYGRTGTMFAVEHSGIEPDIITVAKSIAAGLPLAAVIGRAEIMDAPLPGGLGGTYAGNPLACAAALAVLEIFERERLVERARHIGTRIERALRELQRRHPSRIGDVRGLGAMLALELSQTGKRRDGSIARDVVEEARERGVLLLTCGPNGNVIRILVPLVIGDDDLSDALQRLAHSCDAVFARA